MGPWTGCSPEATLGYTLTSRLAPKFREGGDPRWTEKEAILIAFHPSKETLVRSGLITAFLPSYFPQGVLETMQGLGK